MKVEKVMVRTIESKRDRQLAVKACLLDSGVPECMIKMHMGYDGTTDCEEDLRVTEEKVDEVLAAEGLRFRENEKKFTHTCSSLSFYQAFKQISDSGKTTMLMNDDKRLKIPLYELQELLSELPDDAKGFQPQWYLHPDGEYDFDYIKVRFPEGLRYPPFVHGFLADGNDVLIFTPKGATWAYEQIHAKSACLRAGDAVLRSESEGLYTSLSQLTAEIGGQEYWESGHGGH